MELEKQFYPYADDVYYPKETTVTYLVEITDNFAIGFAEWMHSNTIYNGTEYYSVIGHIGHHKLDKLLQIYKSKL